MEGLGVIEGFILICVLVMPVIALVEILSSRFRESNNKLVWALVVIFMPILGSILYFLIGRYQRIRG